MSFVLCRWVCDVDPGPSGNPASPASALRAPAGFTLAGPGVHLGAAHLAPVRERPEAAAVGGTAAGEDREQTSACWLGSGR